MAEPVILVPKTCRKCHGRYELVIAMNITFIDRGLCTACEVEANERALHEASPHKGDTK